MTPSARKARNGRRAALSVFFSGAAFSLGANLLASDRTPVGMVVGAFPALMLLGSVYLLENGATHPKWVRWAILPVILVAAWMSYWHIVEVVSGAGEGAVTAHLYALIVDLPMVIASSAIRPAPVARPARKRATATKAKTPAKLKSVA